ncbi:MAG: hypothetical protein JW750_02235 [Anaerolineaceae bacterium]|nr:hypothetical protein [Anaerolineaceae bacterium]
MKDSSIRQRAFRYWYSDGIHEMVFGFGILLVSGFYYLSNQIDLQPTRALVAGLGYPAFLLLVLWSVGKVVKLLKEKISFPRTGYVRFRKPAPSKTRKLRFIYLVVGVAIALSTNILLLTLKDQWALSLADFLIWTFVGLGSGTITLLIGIRTSVWRFFVLSVLSAVGGALIGAFVTGGVTQTVIFLGGNGISWMVSGGLTFAWYLTHTEKPAEGEAADE